MIPEDFTHAGMYITCSINDKAIEPQMNILLSILHLLKVRIIMFFYFMRQMLCDIYVPRDVKPNIMHASPVAIRLKSTLANYVLFMRLCHISGSIYCGGKCRDRQSEIFLSMKRSVYNSKRHKLSSGCLSGPSGCCPH